MADSSILDVNIVTNAVDASGSTVLSIVQTNNIESSAIDATVTTGGVGATGPAGTNGVGVPNGGTANQALTKIDSTNVNTQWATIDKTFVGLGNVDNTTDANKPISTATQTALNAKQSSLTVTNTGSGNATLVAGLLNIPNTTYTLPTASTSVLGGIKVDGTTVTISGGVISATAINYKPFAIAMAVAL